LCVARGTASLAALARHRDVRCLRSPMTSFKHRLRRKRAKQAARKKAEKAKAAKKRRR